MRRIIFLSVMTVIIAVLFVGFGVTKNVENNRAYAQYMHQGRMLIEKAEYSKARTAFENALTKRNAATTPNRLITQIKWLQRANSAAKKAQYATAAKYYSNVLQVDGGSATLNQRASVAREKMNGVVKLSKKINKLYNEAKVLSTRYQYTASNAKLLVIFNTSEAKKKPFRSIYQKALQLYEANNMYLQQLDSTSYSQEQTPQTNSANSEQGNLTPQTSSAQSYSSTQSTRAASSHAKRHYVQSRATHTSSSTQAAATASATSAPPTTTSAAQSSTSTSSAAQTSATTSAQTATTTSASTKHNHSSSVK